MDDSSSGKEKWFLLILLVLVVAYVCVFFLPHQREVEVIDPLEAEQRPRKAKDVVEFLQRPLPLPEGTKLLLQQSDKPYGGPTIRWDSKIALDISELDRKEVLLLHWHYMNYFEEGLGNGGGGEGGRRSLMKFGPNDFGMGSGVYWTFCWDVHRENKFFDLEFTMEVMDFVKNQRVPVRSLGDPIQGQRVAWITIDIRGRNLTGNVKFPVD
jgi:hypothetical protein